MLRRLILLDLTDLDIDSAKTEWDDLFDKVYSLATSKTASISLITFSTTLF